ncbi:MAG: iron-sulfur cluster assembly accessory protein [Rhodanobacteraceae bacterium]|nr:iron-sulfur cluster assembly accessory protein [Rhodanobacteraceae bacterium]
MSITLTTAAASRVREFVGAQDGAIGLRLGVRRTGCSGWAYAVDVARELAADDQVFEQDGVKVVVDAKALPLLDGTEIDFVRQGLNRQFSFRNPNVAGGCGCGESFSVERAAI